MEVYVIQAVHDGGEPSGSSIDCIIYIKQKQIAELVYDKLQQEILKNKNRNRCKYTLLPDRFVLAKIEISEAESESRVNGLVNKILDIYKR